LAPGPWLASGPWQNDGASWTQIDFGGPDQSIMRGSSCITAQYCTVVGHVGPAILSTTDYGPVSIVTTSLPSGKVGVAYTIDSKWSVAQMA
jgi:hypothetical protein